MSISTQQTKNLNRKMSQGKRLLVAAFAISAFGCTRQEMLEPVIVDKSDVSAIDTNKTASYWDMSSTQPSGKKQVGSANQKPGEKTVFTEDESKAAFQALCKGGKPKHKVEFSVQYIVPPPQAGILLKSANNFTKDQQFAMRLNVFALFHQIAFGPWADRLAGRDLTSGQPNSVPRGYPMILEAKDEGDGVPKFVQLVKSSAATRQQFCGEEGFASSRGKVEHSSNCGPVFLHVKGKSDRWVMGVVDFNSFFQRAGSLYPPRGYHEIVPLELFAIAENYVLTVSKSESQSWSDVAKARHAGNVEVALADGNTASADLLPDFTMVGQKKDIFDSYLIANTRVKQSTTDDSQVFEFKVALDTEPLCRLARPDSDFISR